MDMKPQKPTPLVSAVLLRHLREEEQRGYLKCGKEDKLPFSSVMRSARWRALERVRFSVGQDLRRKGRAGEEDQT